MPLLIGLVILVIVGAVGFMMLNQRRQTDTVSNRLAQFTERSMNLEDLELQLPFMQRIVTPILNNVFVKLGQSAKGNDKLRTNLMLAGNPGNLTPAMFTGMRIFIALALFGIVLLSVSWPTLKR